MRALRNSILAFEDGTVFRGEAFGASVTSVGEACFNTSMTGYQEILTDPSYFGQIVTMTPPQIGNYGVNWEDPESKQPQVKGFVVRELSPNTSNWRSEGTLSEYLEKYGIPGIQGVDTRSITKKLRVSGALKCCLSTEEISVDEAIDQAKAWDGMQGKDYVSAVTCESIYEWDSDGEESIQFTVPGTELDLLQPKDKRFKVVAFDYGAKLSIYKKLKLHGFDVTVLPASTSAEQVDELKPDCVFLSNGPGDPAAVGYAHEIASKLIQKYPTFGICMGHQILTHALGADTFKLKFGHRGGNQPVKNLETGKVSITSQNHGFASSKEEVERVGGIVTEINLNDDTVEGIRHKELPVFSVQYHPEAAPGPNDADPLFEKFYELVKMTKGD
ncbi:MAG: glutamine-hydrolyzing carbamoyl-phosphate synthase small subunit [Verrucomicrobiota bacterium]